MIYMNMNVIVKTYRAGRPYNVINGIVMYKNKCRHSDRPYNAINFLIQQNACRHGDRRYRRFVAMPSISRVFPNGFATLRVFDDFIRQSFVAVCEIYHAAITKTSAQYGALHWLVVAMCVHAYNIV